MSLKKHKRHKYVASEEGNWEARYGVWAWTGGWSQYAF